MSLISNFVVPEDDELAYSWFARIAYVNAEDMGTFCCNVVGNPAKSFEVTGLLEKAYDKFGNNWAKDLVGFCDRFTLMRSGVFGCTDVGKSRYIMQLQGYHHMEPLGRLKSIQVCPECLAGDDGIHRHICRKHQLPGVTVCYKHGCRLRVYENGVFRDNNVPGFENIVDIDNYIPLDSSIPNDKALEYAQCITQLFDEDFGLRYSFDTLYSVLYRKAGKIGYDSYTLENMFKNSEYVCLAETGENYLSKKKCSLVNAVAVALFLYDGCNGFDEFIADIKKTLNGDRIVEKTCGACGNVYLSTGWLESNGVGCSCEYDNSSADDFYRPLIAGDGKYYPFAITSGGALCRIKHNACGKECHRTPSGFVFDGLRCRCETLRSDVTAKMDKVFGFEVVKYPERDENVVFVRHVGCGKMFEVKNLDVFVKNPVCEWCGRHSEDDFKDYIYDISGGEYSVANKYEGQSSGIYAKHNVCGKVKRYAYSTFVGSPNPECRYCSIVNESQTKGTVANLIYSVGYGNLIRLDTLVDTLSRQGENFDEARKNVYSCIIKMENLDIVYRLYDGVYAFVGYELNDFDVVDTVTLYVYLTRRFAKTDIIRFNGLDLKYIKRNRLDDFKKTLVNTGMLRRIFDDMYVFAENKKEYSSMELLEAYYININGKRIGRYAVSDRPEADTGRLYIKTTVISPSDKYYPSGIAAKLGVVASVKGCIFEELDKVDERVVRNVEADTKRNDYLAREKKLRQELGAQNIKEYNDARMRTFDDVSAEVNKLGNGDFELVSYSVTNEKMIVRHRCGHNILTLLYNFRKCQYCERCSGTMNDNKFREEVRNLVGDEYVVKGEYNGYHAGIELLHTVCGHIYIGDPANFLAGNRCPNCRQVMTRDYLVNLVSCFTSGHYSVGNDGTTAAVLITDNKTGKTFTLSTAMIKQELMRPTRSDILVLNDDEEKARQILLDGRKGVNSNKQDSFLSYLRSKYGVNDLIFTDEFVGDGQGGYTREESKTFFRGLVKKKVLRTVAKSVYTFVENNKDYTEEELFENKYVNRNGVKIGEWVEYVLPDGKKEKRLRSTKVADAKWREYTFVGVVVKIMGIKDCPGS